MGFISVKDLKPGMRLKSDLVSEKGQLFLIEGTVLSEKILDRIRELEFTYVNIAEEGEIEEYHENYGEWQEQLNRYREERFKRVYSDAYNSVKDLFEGVRYGNSVNMEDVRESINTLMSLVMEDSGIVYRLQKLQEKDDYTYRHSINVSLLSAMIGKWLKMDAIDLKKLAYAGLFHDLGKSIIPLEIINKPGPLNQKEWEKMKYHPIHGYNILKNTPGLSRDVLLGVLMHHEREDGRGYPFGIKGDNIHKYAKIIAVADIYDALTSNRAYKKKESPFKAAELISYHSFTNLDPKVARTFLERISNYFVGCRVRLSDGRTGKVIYIYPRVPAKPIVMVGDEFIDFSKRQEVWILEVIE